MLKAKDIENSLKQQLKEKGVKSAYIYSLADDYVFLWQQMQDMKKSIKKKGRLYKAISAVGKEYEKENPAIRDIPVYNRQMLAILKELKCKVDDESKEEADDEL